MERWTLPRAQHQPEKKKKRRKLKRLWDSRECCVRARIRGRSQLRARRREGLARCSRIRGRGSVYARERERGGRVSAKVEDALDQRVSPARSPEVREVVVGEVVSEVDEEVVDEVIDVEVSEVVVV